MDIKINTLNTSNITQVDGFYRFINHIDKIATTGFRSKDVLLVYADSIRFDSQALSRMNSRYVAYYETDTLDV